MDGLDASARCNDLCGRLAGDSTVKFILDRLEEHFSDFGARIGEYPGVLIASIPYGGLIQRVKRRPAATSPASVIRPQ
jgi:hypothetical protein